MNHTRLLTAAVIIAIVVVIGFVLSVPHTRDVANTELSQQIVETSVPTVSLRDTFKKGVHTISGSIAVPNICTEVTAEASLISDESGSENIRVALSLSEDTGICLQLPARVNFSTTLSAPANLPLSATVNGLLATTTAS